MRFLVILFISACFCSSGFAQPALPLSNNLQTAYNKQTRSLSGMPGKNYWQNKAAYDIHVAFEPTTRLLSGTEIIVYENNSPDTLRELVFKLYPNLYKKGAERLKNIDEADAGDGMSIKFLTVNKDSVAANRYKISGTNMIVPIPALLPGAKLVVQAGFNYVLNKGSHIRTGEIENGAYFLAYFFPRIAVYDDIDGWNMHPYLGTQEFYNDFCDFNLNIRVPGKYIVWATGDLVNGTAVFENKYLDRIRQAETKDAVLDIIDSADLKAGGITKPADYHEWNFKSAHVTDAVFALSDHYCWQSSSLVVDQKTGRRTRVDAVYNQVHADYREVIHDARKTVDAMSYRFPKWPFPYSHETVFDGLDQMEYPMMVNDNPLKDRFESIELTDHEIFHTMFPFYMGINETKYGWMDEGWATIGEWLISPMIDPRIVDEYGVKRYEIAAGTEMDLPITTLTTQEVGQTMFINSYPKPAMGYLFVKDMLGDSLFLKALHYYISQWNGKHPIPNDFFNCMNAGSGKNLDWFWKKWFMDDGVPDLAIAKFTSKGKQQQVIIKSKGTKPVPVDLTVVYTDGTTEKFHRSIAIWEKGNKKISINFTTDKKLANIKLGSVYVPDVDKKNNELVITK